MASIAGRYTLRMDWQAELPFNDQPPATRVARVKGVPLAEGWAVARLQAVKPRARIPGVLYTAACERGDPERVGYLLTLERIEESRGRTQRWEQTVFVGRGAEMDAFLAEQARRVVAVLPALRALCMKAGAVVDDSALRSEVDTLMVIPEGGFPVQSAPGLARGAGIVPFVRLLKVLAK